VAVAGIAVQDDPIRLALVGCGDIGAKNAQAIHEARGVELAHTFDVVAALADELAGRYGGSAADSLEAAVQSTCVDAVLVATPHDTHESVARAALDAGKHVLLEKPLAADLAAAVRITQLAQRSGAVVAVLFPLRSDPRFRRTEQALASDGAGPISGAVASYVFGKPPDYYSGGFSNRSPSSWRTSNQRSGGGVLMMNLLHDIDAVRALIGREASSVFARMVMSAEHPEIEDMATVIVDFDGVLATFVGTASGYGGEGDRIELWNASRRIVLLPDGTIARKGREPEAPAEPPNRLHSRIESIARFAQAVRDDSPPTVAVADALAVQAIVTAAYMSAEEERIVCVGDVLREAGWTPDREPSDSAEISANELVATAMRAVTAVPAADYVEVVGSNSLSDLIRRLLPAEAGDGRPMAVIETSGAEPGVQRALRAVAPLGTVVIAAPARSPSVPVAAYEEIHKRCLTVIGVPWTTDATDVPEWLVEWAQARLAQAHEGA
jgi:predicted dehydrogenase